MLLDNETGRVITEESDNEISRACTPAPELRVKEIKECMSANTFTDDDNLGGDSGAASPKKDVEIY